MIKISTPTLHNIKNNFIRRFASHAGGIISSYTASEKVYHNVTLFIGNVHICFVERTAVLVTR